MKVSNVKDTKKLRLFLFENITEIYYEYEDEKSPRHSEAGKNKYLRHTLNSINDFLMFLVISYMVSRFKLLRIS